VPGQRASLIFSDIVDAKRRSCEDRGMISPTDSPVKTVHLIPQDAAIKNLCFDAATQTLRPNLVLVDRNGEVVFEINELGLKGDARDPARKLAVVWGDSVVFGIRRSWPCRLDQFAPGYQFLNGGIEGDPYDNILRRAAAFNREHAVALNIVMLGWHPWRLPSTTGAPQKGPGLLQRLGLRGATARPRGAADADPPSMHRQLGAELSAFLRTVPNTVLATMPTALNRQIVDRDLSSWFRGGDRDTVFSFAGDLPYSLAAQHHMFNHITERNAILREVAQASGLRLVDLAAAFDTEALADFRADFHDMLHLRPSAYSKAAAAVYRAINDLL
jgi:hypothetical protein